MIQKIIANGTSVAATAALNVAIKLGLAYSGWCDDNSPLLEKYRLSQVTGLTEIQILEKAILASQGSLCFIDADGETLYPERIKKVAARRNRPHLTIDLAQSSGFFASQRIATWISENRIVNLYVDGQKRYEPSTAAVNRIAKILEAVFFLSMNDTYSHVTLTSIQETADLTPQAEHQVVKTVEEALDDLEHALSLKDKATIANMTAGELVSLHASLGNYIDRHFELYSGNGSLLADCLRRSDGLNMAPEGATTVIVHSLWERLRATYRIRVVK